MQVRRAAVRPAPQPGAGTRRPHKLVRLRGRGAGRQPLPPRTRGRKARRRRGTSEFLTNSRDNPPMTWLRAFLSFIRLCSR